VGGGGGGSVYVCVSVILYEIFLGIVSVMGKDI
jgi:hypothetical protein